MSVALLAEIMTGATASTEPEGVLIVVFCQPLKGIKVFMS